MRVFTGVGILLCVLAVRDLRRGFKPKVMLLRRHIRYILASYYYFLTVVSIDHLDDELPRKAKWLWPTVVGAFVIYFASTNSVPALVRNPGKVLKWSVGITLITGVSFALYAAFELFRGTGFMGQAMVVAN